MQASNERDRDEWINAINNLIEDASPESAASNVISAKHEQHQQQSGERRKSKEDASPIFTAPIQFDMLTPVDDKPPSAEPDAADVPAFSYTLKVLNILRFCRLYL